MRFRHLFLFSNNNWDINDIFVNLFLIGSKDPWIKENANSSEYPVYTLLSNARTCAHTHTHFSFACTHAVVTRAWDRYVHRCTKARAYMCTRKSAFYADTVDCVARDAYRDVWYTHVCTYMLSHGVCVPTRRQVHRRHWVAGGGCSIFTLCLIAGYGVDYINLIPTRARRRALDSKRERFRGEGASPRVLQLRDACEWSEREGMKWRSFYKKAFPPG